MSFFIHATCIACLSKICPVLGKHAGKLGKHLQFVLIEVILFVNTPKKRLLFKVSDTTASISLADVFLVNFEQIFIF